MRTIWELWCKSIGQKAFADNKKADKVAIIRSIWVMLHVITCIFIILNAIATHGWKLLGI